MTPPDTAALPTSRRDRQRGPLDWLALLPVLALAAFMTNEARLFFKADLHLLEARWLVGAWASGERPMTPAAWLRAYDATQRAIDTHPADAHLRIQMGALYQMAANLPQQTPVQQQLFLRQAAGQYRHAVAARPLDGWAWSSLAELLQATEPGSAEAWQAWRRAERHAPLEDPVRLALLRAAFTGWAAVPPDVKAWVGTAYSSATPAQQQEIDDTALAWGAPDWRGAAASPPAYAASAAVLSPEFERWAAAVEAAIAKGQPIPPPPLGTP